LSILAYRGPLTRAELEQIRGVQSAIILRNLMLRGLVETREEARLGQPVFQVTMDFVKHLGLARLEDLPDFTALHTHPTVEQVLDQLEPKATSSV
jgi:segregation and condensation protein B